VNGGVAGSLARHSGENAGTGAVPTGTVTFLFSDIEGSTRRWDADRAAMSEALARHDALVRSALTANAGYVFKTLGDGFCCAFTEPENALAAAVALQRSLAAETFSAVDGLRIRIALHTGTADEREGDYYGPTVNRVARLLSTAHGEQVVVSEATYDAARNAVASWATFKDLGVHCLKDLSVPERVYQLVAPQLRVDFSPLRSLTEFPNNLPAHLSSFIGREHEVKKIAALIGAKRLVTLVGSGGIGKTRTSLQVAANVLEATGDGVWFIELAPLATGEYIPAAVAQAMGLSLLSDGDTLEHLVRALKTKHALLIFDNCEHLVGAAARVIAALLRGCARVKVLASSRQALGITGEEHYRLPSLDVPQVEHAERLLARDAINWSAIALFVERAHAVDRRFALTNDNALAVADICRRLDGIPLALELAAARVKILTPRQLHERLDKRFGVLTGGSRDALPRQQTLRALIDWSYELLDEPEQRLFRRLAIFVNGFALEGALAVGRDDETHGLDGFDVLASLVDKSLVLAEPVGDETRYRLLESTRAYAFEKLDAAGERDTCANLHLLYLRDRFAEANERYTRTLRPADVDGLLASELEDLRAALDSSLAGPRVMLGAELLAQFARGWGATSLYDEGLTRTMAFVAALPRSEPLLLARLLTHAVLFATNCGNIARARELATEAIAFARASHERPILTIALIRYASVLVHLRVFDAAETALREAEQLTPHPEAARLLLLAVRSQLSLALDDFESAARAQEQLRKEYRFLGNVAGEIAQTINLAETLYKSGHSRRAIALVEEIVPLAVGDANRLNLAQALGNLAGYLAAVDDVEGTRCAARRAVLELGGREPEAGYVASAIEHLALGLALRGDLELAAVLAGYADAALRRRGLLRQFTEMTSHVRLNALLHERLPLGELTRLLAEGAALSPEAAVTRALELPSGADRPRDG
jgi:predicted ATPase/class 3 adenylate cyclase